MSANANKAISVKPFSKRRKLLLITAPSPEFREARRARVLNLQQITMPYLAVFASDNWDGIHADEAVSPIDMTIAIDLVGIAFHNPSAFHAYGIAAEFRARGIPVMLGGPHVTLMPEEAQDRADVIFVGEAEDTLVQFFKEFERGRH